MKYLAIGFWFENQDFTLSVHTDSEDPGEVSDLLTQGAQMQNKDYLCAVLLVENSDTGTPPRVVKFWRGENGDFETVAPQIH